MVTNSRRASRKKTSTKKLKAGAKSSALQIQNDLLKSILDHVADPIFVKDRKHRLIYGNRALSEMIGLPSDEYIGKDDYEFFPKEEADVFWEKDNKVFETCEVDLNEEHLTDSQGKLHIISTKKARCVIMGHEPVIVGVIRDITAFKEVESLKSDFVAMISHELRTPLTSIYASLELLASGTVQDVPTEIEEMIRIAYKNSLRLVRLVNEILDVEKIEAGIVYPKIEPVPVARFLEKALEENGAYGKKYGVIFELGEVPKDCCVLADSNRLMQVMANLLSNASKFSKRGSKVIMGAMQINDEHIRFEVRDYGIGIPEKFHVKIFEKFWQSDSSETRHQDGTGLGLNITKRLVEAMGGNISFKSNVDVGTTFYVDLPMAYKDTKKKTNARRYAAR